MLNRSTKKTPFEVVYTSVPRHTVDLIRLPLSHDVNSNAEEFAGIQQIHQVKIIERSSCPRLSSKEGRNKDKQKDFMPKTNYLLCDSSH